MYILLFWDYINKIVQFQELLILNQTGLFFGQLGYFCVPVVHLTIGCIDIDLNVSIYHNFIQSLKCLSIILEILFGLICALD